MSKSIEGYIISDKTVNGLNDLVDPSNLLPIDLSANNVNGGVKNILGVVNGGTGTSSAGQNQFLAGPISGGSGPPTFRTIAAADVAGTILNGLTTNTFPIATSSTSIGNSQVTYSTNTLVNTGPTSSAAAMKVIPTSAGYSSYFKASNSASTADVYFGLDGTGLVNGHVGQVMNYISGTATDFYWSKSGTDLMHLDNTGNLTLNGTIANASTSGTANDTASTLMLRDANSNSQINNLVFGSTTITSSGISHALTVASPNTIIVTGSLSDTFVLPDATTLVKNTLYLINNNSSAGQTINGFTGTTLNSVMPGYYIACYLVDNSTSAGQWDTHYSMPSTIGPNQVLAGPTSGFTPAAPTARSLVIADVPKGTANYPIVGNGASASAYQQLGLTTGVTGVLPVANGGTNQSSALTAGGVVYSASTTAMASTGAGTTGQFLQSNAGSAPTWASIGGVISGLTTNTFTIATSATTIGNSNLTYSTNVLVNTSPTNTASVNRVVPTTAGYASYFNASNSSNGGNFYCGLDGTGLQNTHPGYGLINVTGTADRIYAMIGSTDILTINTNGLDMSSGKSITFNGGSNFTYSEGSWTPNITAATDGVINSTATGVSVAGTYRKYGNVVTITFYILFTYDFSGGGHGSQLVWIGNLPFAYKQNPSGTVPVGSLASYDWGANLDGQSNPVTCWLHTAGGGTIHGRSWSGSEIDLNGWTPAQNEVGAKVSGSFTYHTA